MCTNQDVYNAINQMAPFSTAMSWDNVGLLIGSSETPVKKALLALDVTSPVLEEAVSTEANLIITHHPIIFKALSQIQADSLVYRLIAAGISVISAHTNLDMAPGGVNDSLAACLGLMNLHPFDAVDTTPWCKVVVFVPETHKEAVYSAMSQAGGGTLGEYSGCAFLSQGMGRFLPGEQAAPYIGQPGVLETVEEVKIEMVVPPPKLSGLLQAMKEAHPYEEVAYDVLQTQAITTQTVMGRIGQLPVAVEPDVLAAQVKAALGAPGIRYVAGNRPIQKVVVCSGGGAEYIYKAHKMGAQALVTGESKHNLMLDASEMGMTLIDAGHFATETVVLPSLLNHLQRSLPDLVLGIATNNKDCSRFV